MGQSGCSLGAVGAERSGSPLFAVPPPPPVHRPSDLAERRAPGRRLQLGPARAPRHAALAPGGLAGLLAARAVARGAAGERAHHGGFGGESASGSSSRARSCARVPAVCVGLWTQRRVGLRRGSSGRTTAIESEWVGTPLTGGGDAHRRRAVEDVSGQDSAPKPSSIASDDGRQAAVQLCLDPSRTVSRPPEPRWHRLSPLSPAQSMRRTRLDLLSVCVVVAGAANSVLHLGECTGVFLFHLSNIGVWR